MPSIIPLTEDSFQQEVILGMTLVFYWNVRDNSWRMSITINDIVIVSGIKLVTAILLLNPYFLGIGDFLVVENSVNLTDPTREGFVSGQFTLIYFTQDEINSRVL